jgi:hypothetical protein
LCYLFCFEWHCRLWSLTLCCTLQMGFVRLGGDKILVRLNLGSPYFLCRNMISSFNKVLVITVYNVIQNKTSNTILIITTLYLRFIYIFGLLTLSVYIVRQIHEVSVWTNLELLLWWQVCVSPFNHIHDKTCTNTHTHFK